jgi:hypothetical protein
VNMLVVYLARCIQVENFIFLSLDLSIMESKSAWGNGIRPSLQDCIG